MDTSPNARDAPWREFRVSPARLRHGLVLAGAMIMFWGLGFIPASIIAKILQAANLLRIPKEIELLGLDFGSQQEADAARRDVVAAEQAA